MQSPLWIVTSSVLDTVYRTQSLPRPGASVFVSEIQSFLGGKGTNQAIAAARLGAEVRAIGMLGMDEAAERFFEVFRETGIQTKHISQTNQSPTGQAAIVVQQDGLNQIAVHVGANLHLSAAHVHACEMGDLDICLCQFEVADEVLEAVASKAKLILNPAPYRPVPRSLLESTWAITPNETETQSLTHIEPTDESSMRLAADTLHGFGIEHVVLTLGERGAFMSSPNETGLIPAPRVEPKDSTAAGDVFNGAFAYGIASGWPTRTAVELAVAAASYSVTFQGALNSAPSVRQLKEFANQHQVSLTCLA